MSIAQLAASKPRHLYALPDRRVPKAKHAPPGRALVLIDLENMVGGSSADTADVVVAMEAVQRIAAVRATDHVEVGLGPSLARALPGALRIGVCLRIRSGLDGGERIIIDQFPDLRWVAARFDRVVIASGDHLFTLMTNALTELGVPCEVVAWRGTLAGSLRRAATVVRFIDETGHLSEAA